MMDMWFVDDSVVFTKPHDADQVLRAFDKAIQKIGATRGTGRDVKSVARIVCPADEETLWADAGWTTEYIRDTCEVREPNAPIEYLGTTVAGAQELAKSLKMALEKHKRKGKASKSWTTQRQISYLIE